AGREAARRPYREDRLDRTREGHDLAVGGDPRELEARTGGGAAVGVGRAGPEAVRRGVGRATLLPGRAVQHVGPCDRLPDDDRRTRSERRARGGGGGGGRGGGGRPSRRRRCGGRGGRGPCRGGGTRGRRRGCRGRGGGR